MHDNKSFAITCTSMLMMMILNYLARSFNMLINNAYNWAGCKLITIIYLDANKEKDDASGTLWGKYTEKVIGQDTTHFEYVIEYIN